jgi:hypothetical protein
MKTHYGSGDLRLALGSDYLKYVDEVILCDPRIVVHNSNAVKQIRASCLKNRQPRPEDADLNAFFRAHWREWVRLSMKNVRVRPNPTLPRAVVASQQTVAQFTIFPVPTVPPPTTLPFPTGPQATHEMANDGAPSEIAKIVLSGLMAQGGLGTYMGMLLFLRELFGHAIDTSEDEIEVPKPFITQC